MTLGALRSSGHPGSTSAHRGPVVLAAYQHVYATADMASSDRATALTMATLYLPRRHSAARRRREIAFSLTLITCDNHRAAPTTADLLRRWYDFVVGHDELLLDPRDHRCHGCFVGDYNGDYDVSFRRRHHLRGRPTRHGLAPRHAGRRPPRRSSDEPVGQTDTLWDAPRQPFGSLHQVYLVRLDGNNMPARSSGRPDRHPAVHQISGRW